MANHDSVEHRGDPLTRGRKFDAGELHLMLLSLLAERPSYGYGLIKEFRARSNGFYSPSPGVVYPVLARLEGQGHATVQADGKRKRYSLSDAGHAYLNDHLDEAQHLFAVLQHAARKMLWMKQAVIDEESATAATGWLPEFVAARRALKATLLSRSGASHQEQRRVANILQEAIAAIQKTESDKEYKS